MLGMQLKLEPRNTCRLYCAMTMHVKMWRAAGVSVYSPRRLPGRQISGKRKSISEQKKHYCSVQDVVRLPIVVLFPLI